ncbi:MAG TPA: hypothetical protein VMA75_03450 [Candidatus Paceibacterota bacterium]|nr:hypothetical protein [Candidatus Paceibacterota bacterium]
MEEEKKEDRIGEHTQKYWEDMWTQKALRSRPNWYTWDSPVGLGLAWTLLIVPLGIFLWLLHLANLIH